MFRQFIATAILVASVHAFAQTYPSKPIRLIAPFAAGGGADYVARERLAALGGEVVANTPAEFAARIRDDLAKWHKLVAAIGLKAGEGG